MVKKKKTIQIESMSMTIPVYQYRDSDGNMYFQTSFEYLNTYYSISAMLEENEFIKIIENIIIKKCVKVSKIESTFVIYM